MYARTPDGESIAHAADVYRRLAAHVEQSVLGKPEVVRLAVVCLLAEGHLLLEDVPGVAKTTLAVSIAGSFGGDAQRVQFTPDLLPSDITGTVVLRGGDLRFDPGPVFASVLHADEINRAMPKTQSALLQVMEERQVTVHRETRSVKRPFFVIATQNPIELEGTYPLPEAQLDRFLLRTAVGYPDHATEMRLVRGENRRPDVRSHSSVTDADVRTAIDTIKQLPVADAVCDYVVRLTRATREHTALRLGASPRGSLALVAAARAYAVSHGRGDVLADDVKAVAHAVLDHRLLLSNESSFASVRPEEVVEGLLDTVPAPPLMLPRPA